MKEIKDNLTTGKLIIGTKRTMKKMKQSTVEKVFLAKNCPGLIVDDIKHFASLGDVEVEQLDTDCDEFGSICKKPFHVSVASILK
ncbi:MAG: ribosomal L7Ae/L30e/S12e/Gadd45 family protein [Candidatus Woesearchaeota archaeon]